MPILNLANIHFEEERKMKYFFPLKAYKFPRHIEPNLILFHITKFFAYKINCRLFVYLGSLHSNKFYVFVILFK